MGNPVCWVSFFKFKIIFRGEYLFNCVLTAYQVKPETPVLQMRRLCAVAERKDGDKQEQETRIFMKQGRDMTLPSHKVGYVAA